jgi:putative ABC transport system permease protein
MRWLLRRLVSERDRRAIESDLAELYEWRRRRDGDHAAARWLRHQVLIYPLHLFRERVLSAVAQLGGNMRGLWRDVQHSAKSLLRTPGLTLTIVLTVGIALGATAAMASLTRAVLIDPLPYRAPEELVSIYTDYPPYRSPFSVVDYRALEQQQTSFERIAGSARTSVVFSNDALAEQVSGKNVTWSYFSLLGIAPLHGRVFDQLDDEPGRLRVVLGHAFWTERFAADPAAVGRAIVLDGVPHTIVGILPPHAGPLERGVALFTAAHWPTPQRKGPFFVSALGRLKPGVSAEAAGEELRTINRRLFPIWQSSYQDSRATWGLLNLKARIVGTIGPTLYFVLAAVACVLLIACANAVNLLVARTMHRGRELAVRSALGASRRRLLQHVLSESGVLAIGAAIVGLSVAAGAIQLLSVAGVDYIPRVTELRLSGPVLGWLMVLTAASAALLGLVPAFQSSRLRLDMTLRSGGRSATDGRAARRLRRVLVAVEFAIATPLIVAAALLASSLDNLRRVDVGVDSPRLLTAAISLPEAPYADEGVANAFWERAEASVRTLPGVEAVGFADGRPPADVSNSNNFDLEDDPTPPGQSQPQSAWLNVGPTYFPTMGLALARGRLLDERDALADAGSVVVVDRAWASRFFPNAEPIGRRFREGGCTQCEWTTVVGMVGTVKYFGLDSPDPGTIYSPLGPRNRERFVVIRTAADRDPTALVPGLRQRVRELDPALAVANVATVSALVSEALEAPRYLSVLTGTFAISALVLSLLGIYGVMSYFVQQQARDIGIRLALGGEPSRIRRMVVRQGLTVVVAGVVIGIGGALVGARLMATLLFGVGPTDVRTLIAVPGALVIVALVACLLPARRAAAVDPATVLRES